MRVWIDADACPKAAKELVVKFALKRQFEVVLVAGQPQPFPGGLGEAGGGPRFGRIDQRLYVRHARVVGRQLFPLVGAGRQPTGAQRDAIKQGSLTAAQVSYVIHPAFAVTASFGWARTRDIAKVASDVRSVLNKQYANRSNLDFPPDVLEVIQRFTCQ